MRKRKFYVILCTFFFACGGGNDQIKFDKEKWSVTNDDEDYIYRNDMLKDLTTNHALVGIKSSMLKELLGNTDYEDAHNCAYEISDRFPLFGKEHIRMLDFALNDDSVVTSIKIVERDDGY